MKPRLSKHSQQEVAEFFGISQPQVGVFVKQGMPCDMSKEAAQHILKNQKRKSDHTKHVLKELLGSDVIQGKGQAIKTPKSAQEKRSLEELRDYYNEKLSAETNADFQDDNQIKFWNDLYLKAEKCIRDAQAHEKKLGLEQGETIKRAEMERILKGMLFAANACIRNQVKEMAQDLAGKTAAELYEALPSALFGGYILEGMSAVTKTESEVQIPQWVVDCMVGEGERYVSVKEV